jgi:DNA recombination protein RmuC
MVEHCDFTTQTTLHTDDGRLRPDVLVRLPGDKLVVVDSKVPLDAFLTAQEAKTEAERDAALARHARQTREHITKPPPRATRRSSTPRPSSWSCSCPPRASTTPPWPPTLG